VPSRSIRRTGQRSTATVSEPDPLLVAELGAGEGAVLSTAVRLRTPLVLIDERRARRTRKGYFLSARLIETACHETGE
jgi:predicted nucleic acid-binding protein